MSHSTKHGLSLPLDVRPSIGVMRSWRPREWPVAIMSVRLTPRCARLDGVFRDPLIFASVAVGVGHPNASSRRDRPPPFLCVPAVTPTASAHVGVVHSSASDRRLRPPFVCTSSACPLLPSRAVGVAHDAAHVSRLGVPLVGRSCGTSPSFWEDPYGVAEGVGYSPRSQTEPSLTPVRCLHVGRAEEVPRRVVPEIGQGPEYLVEPSNKEPWDVLQEDEARSHVANDPGDVRKEPALVLEPELGSGDGEGLTRESGAHDVHQTIKRRGVELGEIAEPDRSRRQGRVLHPRQEDRRREGVPLDVTHTEEAGDSAGEPQLKSGDASTEGKARRSAEGISHKGASFGTRASAARLHAAKRPPHGWSSRDAHGSGSTSRRRLSGRA